MGEQKEVKRCIVLENSSVAGTRYNGISIKSLLNPISQADRNMLGSRSTEGHHLFSAACEKRSPIGFADGIENSKGSLKVGEPIGDVRSVHNEPQSSFRDNRTISGRNLSGDSHRLQGRLSSQNSAVSKPNGRLREYSCGKPKATKKRKYLKRIGVPRYRTSSPLQPFSRRTNHCDNPIASNVENTQLPNMWRSTANSYPTSCAFAGSVVLTQPSSAHPSNVNAHPSAPVAVRLPQPSLPTPASRSTFGAVQSPDLYIVTDPSGFTFCTFQPPMNLSPDFLVYQYPTTSSIASAHVHILHRQ